MERRRPLFYFNLTVFFCSFRICGLRGDRPVHCRGARLQQVIRAPPRRTTPARMTQAPLPLRGLEAKKQKRRGRKEFPPPERLF